MRIQDFQRACVKRTADYYPQCVDWKPNDWAVALFGEVGEAANFQKKFNRGTLDEETFKIEVGKELADSISYLVLWADSLGIDLEKATIDKFNEVSHRIGASQFLETPLDNPPAQDKINTELREVAARTQLLFDMMLE